MSNSLQLQDAILKAVDTLASARIDKIQADKTVTAQVLKCSNSLTGEYLVSYGGDKIVAFAQEGQTYETGQVVYVLVPQGDFTKRKNIVGIGQAVTDDDNISFVSSALSDYNLIGRNIIDDKNKIQPVGLHSYLHQEYKLLYSHTPVTRTVKDASGKQVTETFSDTLYIDGDELSNNLKEAEAVLIEASFNTRLPKAHRVSQTGRYGLEFVLAFADRDNINRQTGKPTTKYYSYVIDSNNMTGNPFRFANWQEQYQIYPIDLTNFLYIESIVFFEQDFEKEDQPTQASDTAGWGADIFVKDIEFYGLKHITAQNGRYKLFLSMPDGSTFKSITRQQTIHVNATLTENNKTDLSDGTMFYWFKEDNRVTTNGKGFQAYGGAGWYLVSKQDDNDEAHNKGYNHVMETYGSENRAYDNKYKVVAVYKQSLILKETFTIYNEAARRDLDIVSNLGVKFSFDRGVPVLTCTIDGKSENFESDRVNPHKDEWFRFVWSKEDAASGTTIFNETQAEAQKRLDDTIKAGGYTYGDLTSLRSLVTSLEGVSWDKNVLTYPVKSIENNATFKCAVYLKDSDDGEEYGIGSATIILQNEAIAQPTDYYIIIENGDQVFQYSESGVSPCDERLTDPLVVKNLICHFYDPVGLEVNKNTYVVKWRVPLENTMVVTPTQGMALNPANNKIEYNTSEEYPLTIAENFDYFALNNQIQAIVSYQGQEYTQYSNLTFTKVGENGTNGTDIVGKISPTYKINDDTLLAIEVVTNPTTQKKEIGYNTGQRIDQKALMFDLYQRNEKLAVDSSNISWSISGGENANSKYLSVHKKDDGTRADGIFDYDETDKDTRKFRNQIIRAVATWDKQKYYAFYPLPIIYYPYGKNVGFQVKIPNSTTLKSVLYNSDGRNPLYNKNQGISIDIGDVSRYVVWEAEGGAPDQLTNGYRDNPKTPDFRIIREKNAKLPEEDKDHQIGGLTLVPQFDNYEGTNKNPNQIYIIPNDVYTGEYSNNVVKCSIYTSEYAYNNGSGNPQVIIYIPIYMSLNTNELKSINAWDGNKIDINNDENYILAPQIGAGEKDNQNKFTGLVMGTATFYDVSNRDEDGKINDDSKTGYLEPYNAVGLLGYSHGKQSIFLDSKTGSATFGLPEDNNYQDSVQIDGKEVRTSATGVAKYNEGRIELVPGGTSKIGNWKIGSRILYNLSRDERAIPATSTIQKENHLIEPYDDIADETYPNSNEKRYKVSIPHDAEGILLSAVPSYISIKGRMMEDVESDAHYHEASTIIQPYDSFELQLDPNNCSIFTVYRHTACPQDTSFVIATDKTYNNLGIFNMADTDENYNPIAGATCYSTAHWKNTSDGRSIDGWVLQKPFNGDSYVIAIPLRQEDDSGTIYYNFNPLQFYCVLVKGKVGDVFYVPEVESDNNKKIDYQKTIFTNLKWHREAKVGINRQGRFYTNALKDNTTAFNIGPIGAYGRRATDVFYVGAQFQTGSENESKNFAKFFVPTANDGINKTTSPLYITGGTDLNNEYPRDLIMGFQSFSLYARDYETDTDESGNNISHDIKTEQKNHFTLSDDLISFGHGYTLNGRDSYFRMEKYTPVNDKNPGKTELYSTNNLIVSTANDRTTTLTTKDLINSIGNNVTTDVNNNVHVTVGNSFFQEVKKNNWYLKLPNTNVKITDTDFRVNLLQNNNGVDYSTNQAGYVLRYSNNQDSVFWGQGLKLTGKHGWVNINSNQDNRGIQLDANYTDANGTNTVYLHMTPQGGGSASSWHLVSTAGTMKSNETIIAGSNNNGGAKGISAKPYVGSNAFYADSNFGLSSSPYQGGPAYNTISMLSSQDVVSMNGWMYGGDFRFKNFSWENWNAVNEDHHNLSKILVLMYNKLKDLINEEARVRANADSAEAMARANADSTLQTNINNEINSRRTADANLQNAINDERTARQNADTAIRNAIPNVSIFVTKAQFNSHQHHTEWVSGRHALVHWDTYNVNGVGDVSHITGTQDMSTMLTSMPINGL